MTQATTQINDEQEAKKASDRFVSLFTIYLSGTHATIEQRLGVVEGLLRSGEVESRALGLAALEQVLNSTHFRSDQHFEFGARSRDYGYQPQSSADWTRWYRAALLLIERLALTEGMMKLELRDLLAQNFRGLWALAQTRDELERLSRGFADDGFWRDGWAACRQTMQFDRSRLTPEGASRLSALEAELRPTNLREQVLAIVVSDRTSRIDLEDIDIEDDVESTVERLRTTARDLGAAVATNDDVFADLLPDILRGGNQAWAFGCGLAGASPDPYATWTKLIDGFDQIAPTQRNVEVLRGFLAELWELDRDLAQRLLDMAVDQAALVVFLPVLQMAVELDEHGIVRLKRALSVGQVPIWMYRSLAYGRTTAHLVGDALKDLLLLIADQTDGFDIAVEILSMRLLSDNSAQRRHEPELLEVGQELLRRVTFQRTNQRSGDRKLARVVKACLNGPNAASIAAEIAVQLRQAVVAYETNSFDNDNLLKALLELQATTVLDTLFVGDENDEWVGLTLFRHLSSDWRNSADVISCEALIAWCEGDGERRYPLAASIITFAHRSEASDPPIWSEQAKVLLDHAPDAKTVLAVLTERFRPMSWSGSRAAVIESNARLLDSLESHIPSDLIPFVTEAKAQFAQEVARERQRETERDRARDERFEW